MCLQCVTKSKIFATKEEHDFLPGYCLQIATETAEGEWDAGEYGIIRQNDPDFTFPVNLEVEEGAVEEEVSKIKQGLFYYGYATTGFNFISAAIKEGFPYDPNKRIVLTILAEWLFKRMKKWVKEHPALTDEEYGKLFEENV